MSRLDRLFTLLSTSTSSSARHLSAQQLGEVQKTYPDELHKLLARLHPLLRSKRWETRIAAAGAMTAILKEVPTFRPSSILKEEDEDEEDIKVPTFCIDDIIGLGAEALLNGSEGKEYDTAASSSEEQKKRLHAEMGLDVASKLGICQDLVSNDDLLPMENEQNQNLSAREKNLQKRQKRKQAKENESSKKMKIAMMQFYSVSESQKESSSALWPLETFTQFLRRDLKSSAWEERHGAATALREIIALHGVSGGLCEGQSIGEMQHAHVQWMHDLASELLVVLARDRFGDFVSDQVVAPVRETTGSTNSFLIMVYLMAATS